MQEGKVKKPFYKKWWFIVLVLVVVVAAVGGSKGDKDNATPTNNNAVEDNSKQENEVKPIEVTSVQLAQDYEENEIKANNDYKGKVAEISGEVNDIGETLGQTYIVLSAGKEFAITQVQCFFKDKDEISKIANINKGDNVTVIGKIDGKSINVSVDKCKFK
jgi:hypothetical protein